MERVAKAILIIVGIINAFPVVGVVSADVLTRLYGIGVLDGDLLILMRHRALLFGILGALLFASAFKRRLRAAAIIAGLVSMVGFVVLALLEGDFGSKIGNVVLIDVVASVALGAVAVYHLRSPRRGSVDT